MSRATSKAQTTPTTMKILRLSLLSRDHTEQRLHVCKLKTVKLTTHLPLSPLGRRH